MKYRRFGTLDWKVSALGFGIMRLPVINQDPAKIDETEAIRMIRYAVDNGLNYIDTAYSYHGGNSETLVAKALEDGYRDKVRVATKMPTWLVNSYEDMDKFLREQLQRLQADYIDFYLLHGLDKERWAKMQNLKVLSWAEKAIKEGKIRYLGFSFHDEFEVFKEIIEGYDGWSLCQIQYNYVDMEYQAGIRGLRFAASKGLAVVVMEPIQGGNLAVKPSDEIQSIWGEAKIQRTLAEWALQWVWNQPEVSVALSGMSTMNQVMENVQSANQSGPGTLTADELKLISRVREKYLEYGFIGCTRCQYCTPCPHDVAIPEILALFNEYYTKREQADAQKDYKNKYVETIPRNKWASQCAKCGECEEKCPQQLPIRDLIAGAKEQLEPEEKKEQAKT